MDRATYLVYGPSGVGKISFALTFLQQGAVRGESVALVTGRPAASVLAQARQAGLELERHLEEGRLLLLEYPEDVEELARTQMDDGAIIGEFLDAPGMRSISRWVFDPVTPLLPRSELAFAVNRYRTISSALSSTGATSLLLMDIGGNEQVARACWEQADGAFRFDHGPYPTGSKRLTLERMPGYSGGLAPIAYELLPGVGLVANEEDAAAVPAMPPSVPRLPSMGASIAPPVRGADIDARIVLVHPAGPQRDLILNLLNPRYQVGEAMGVAECLARTASENPHLLILSMATRGVPGTEIARKLRQNGRNLPILLIGEQFNRRSDEIAALEAGVDVCLQSPVDGRLLLLNVHNLLCRSGARGRTLEAPRMMAPPRRDPVSSTTDPGYFVDRVRRELEYANHYSLPLALFSLRTVAGFGDVDELSAVAATLSRAHDLIYVGSHGVAVCLAEADDCVPFLDRLRARWKHEVMPVTGTPKFEANGDPLGTIQDFLATSAGVASVEQLSRA